MSNDWRPIETAPHNVMVLCFSSKPSRYEEAFFYGWRHALSKPEQASSCFGGFVSATHWMPIPEPPVDIPDADPRYGLSRKVC